MPGTGEVLVVDADQDVAAFIVELLSDEGYAVRAVRDVDSARAAIADATPDLVLCDLFVLGRAAVDCVMTLHLDGFADIPIVLTTTDVWTAKRLGVPGIAFCLIKPFNLDELLECVAAHTRRHTLVLH
jgi:DNA-binding response OmpR family regulator